MAGPSSSLPVPSPHRLEPDIGRASFCRRLPVLLVLLLASCATRLPDPTKKPVIYNPQAVSSETGIASWYRDHRTASGERFSGTALAGAHKKLPFGTKVRVIDLKTNKSIIIRINDRGPYIRGRIIDLTVGAARQLGMYDRGIAKVRMEVLKEIPILTKPNLHEKPAVKPKPTPKPAAPPAPVTSVKPLVKPSPKPKTPPSAKPQPTPKPTVKPTPKPSIKPQAKPPAPSVEKPSPSPKPATTKPARGRSR